MARTLASPGPRASLLVVLAVLWTLSAVAMAVREAGVPLQPHNTTTAKYHGFEGGGGARTRGEHKSHHANTRRNPATTSSPHHHALGPRPLHPRDRDSDSHIREYLELINTTSNLAGHSVQPAYASKLGLAMPRGSTPPPPRPAGPKTSSTQAHVGGPRRQVVAPTDFTLTPSLRLLLHHYPSTPRAAPDTTDKPTSWPGRAWRGAEEEGEENVLTKDFNAKFCRVVEDLLLSLARGGSKNLQTATGQLKASSPREMQQEPDSNKASGTTTTTTAHAAPRAPLTPSTTTSSASTAARLLLLHMDGSPAKGALLPTLPYKGKINGSFCFSFFPSD
ncbi:uncharacterized protein LOC127007211 [Eriocheir sinensis]|uniref:uncharacterized protein LOC127007211 n=1 Tax=Eriocheir sinensis TaxID=95602 RepID=UPI0021C81418|nr:uncharacterized protein LOC127007211 [Eriocheir sinensis]